MTLSWVKSRKQSSPPSRVRRSQHLEKAIVTSRPLGRICVLDIETAPDALSLAWAGNRGARSETPATLHAIQDASLLLANETENGIWSDFQLISVTASESGEPELLANVDATLAGVVGSEGTLVSYNGAVHDLPMLRRRAARHLMFERPGISPDTPLPHIDLMRDLVPSSGRRDWARLRATRPRVKRRPTPRAGFKSAPRGHSSG